MRKKMIVGNWKMFTTAISSRQLAKQIVDGLDNEQGVSVVICPPFPYLSIVAESLQGGQVALGAQNLFPEKEGAFTGEVSPMMLLDIGCKYVILGHSERRKRLGETDSFINQKVKVALAAGLEVILCLGETLEQRRAKHTEAVLDQQLSQGLIDLSADHLSNLIVAYEPLWAIGSSGHHATAQQAQDDHVLIRRRFGQLFGETSSKTLRILYGGNVKPDNATALLRQPDVDGALIGGASLDAVEFLAIARAGIVEFQSEVKRT